MGPMETDDHWGWDNGRKACLEGLFTERQVQRKVRLCHDPGQWQQSSWPHSGGKGAEPDRFSVKQPERSPDLS